MKSALKIRTWLKKGNKTKKAKNKENKENKDVCEACPITLKILNMFNYQQMHIKQNIKHVQLLTNVY